MVFRPNSPTGCGQLPEREDPIIEIHIKSNRHHNGKTTVAAVIAKALQQAGFRDVSVHCQDGDYSAVASGALNQDGTVISNKTTHVKIDLFDMNELIMKPNK